MGPISRFEQPIQQAQGLQPFQLPYNELATALLSKQKSLDDKKAALSGLSAYLDKINSIQQDKQIHQQLIDDVNTSINSLYDIDLNSPEGNRQLRETSNRIKSYFGPTGEATKLNTRYANLQAEQKRYLDEKTLEQDPQLRAALMSGINVPDYDSKDWYNIHGPNFTKPYSDKEVNDEIDNTIKTVGEKIFQNDPAALQRFQLNPYNYLAYINKTSGKKYNDFMLALDAAMGTGIKSSVQQDAKYKYGLPDIIANQQSQIFEIDPDTRKPKVDKNGNYIPANTILGRMISQRAAASVETKDDSKYFTYDDPKAKYDLEHPVSNITWTASGIETKPISGTSVTEVAQTLDNYNEQTKEIESYLGIGTNIGWNETPADAVKYGAEFWASKGKDFNVVKQLAERYNNIQNHKSFIQQREEQLEEQAAKSLGIDYQQYKNTKNELPVIPGISKDAALEALSQYPNLKNTFNKGKGQGADKYYNGNKEISKQEYHTISKNHTLVLNSPEYKKYENFIDIGKKLLNKKKDLYKSQKTTDVTASTFFSGLPKKEAEALSKNLNIHFSNPEQFAFYPITNSSNPEFNGQTLNQLVVDGKIPSLKDIDAKSEVGITRQIIKYDAVTGAPIFGLVKRIMIGDGDKKTPVELVFSTDNITSPELQMALNSPAVKANMNSYIASAEDPNNQMRMKDNSPELKPYGVVYDHKRNKTIIGGIDYLPQDGAAIIEKLYNPHLYLPIINASRKANKLPELNQNDANFYSEYLKYVKDAR